MVERGKAAARAVRHMRWGMPLTAFVIIAMIAAVAVAINTPNSNFEIEGDLITGVQNGGGSAPTGDGLDWADDPDTGGEQGALILEGDGDVVDNPATVGTGFFFADDLKVDPDDTTFTNGNKENDFTNVTTLNSGPELTSDTPWNIVSGSVPPNKDDLFNTYNHVYIAAADEADVVLAFERTNNLGSSHVDFELNRQPWEPCASDATRLCPQRVEGDLLISYEISPNIVPVATVFRWDLPGGIDGGGQGLAGTECQGFLAPGGNRTKPCPWEQVNINPADIVATLNEGGPVAAGPWGSRLPNGTATTTIPEFGFFETFLDFDNLGFGPGCPGFANVSVKSRSSDSVTSALQDLAGPFPIDLNTCGEIIIDKVTDPAGGPSFDFDHNIADPTGDVDFSLDDDDTPWSSGQIAPGQYTVEETNLPTGWDLVDISCDDADSTDVADPPTNIATINVAPFETVTCTFTNQARATLIVEKQTDPDGATGDFVFTGAELPEAEAARTLQDGGLITVVDLVPGQYTVTETDPAPAFDLTSIVCDDANSTGDVPSLTATYNLEAGETVTCVFTNTQRGTLIVEKQTNPDGAAGDFVFTGAVLPELEVDRTLQDGGLITVNNLVPGQYTASEADPTSSGFVLESIACDDGNSTGDVASLTATFNIEAGETVTCVFTNATGAVKVTKTAKNFTLGDQPQSGVTFTATAPEGSSASGGSDATDANGVACIDGLTPGVEYTITETVPDNYAARTASQTVTVTAGATCSSGTPDELSFVNDPLSEIQILFTSLAGAGVTAADISCVLDGEPVDPVTENGNAGELDDTDETYTDLIEGTYVCTIVIDP